MSDKSSFSERIRAHSVRTWNAVLGHRFFREVAMDAIDDHVFARYLRIEYGFVDTAARALGYAVRRRLRFKSSGVWAWVFTDWSPIRSRSLLTPSNGWARPTTNGLVARRRAGSSAARTLSQGGGDRGL